MKFTQIPLRGAFLVSIEPIHDERGFFARTWSEQEFRDRGLNPRLKQSALSFNHKHGTLRGMHYQMGDYQEAKLVRCVSGAIFDVIIDLRKGSPTFARHFAIVLKPEDLKMLYVPEGFAHGYQTLTDRAEVFYQMSQVYSPEHARGVRWDDSAFAIDWPEAVQVISSRDRNFPDFDPETNSL